jgi:DNA-binding XRE family transcriptional regulator
VEAKEFADIRRRLSKTQKQMAELLGVSVKAVHSYEQGWRQVPVHVERQILFLLSRMPEIRDTLKACWSVKKCPAALKRKCPAWEFRSGTICWFINGTVCGGEARGDWREKMSMCRECEVFALLLAGQEK